MWIYCKINFSNSMAFLSNYFEFGDKFFEYLEQTSNRIRVHSFSKSAMAWNISHLSLFIATLFNNRFAKRDIFANIRFDNKVQFNHSKICLFTAWHTRKNIYGYKPIQRRDVQVKRLVAIRCNRNAFSLIEEHAYANGTHIHSAINSRVLPEVLRVTRAGTRVSRLTLPRGHVRESVNTLWMHVKGALTRDDVSGLTRNWKSSMLMGPRVKGKAATDASRTRP